MHHKNEVTKIIHEATAGYGLEIDIAKIHQLMDDYDKQRMIEVVNFKGLRSTIRIADIKQINELNDSRYPSIRTSIEFIDGKKMDCGLSYNDLNTLILNTK